MAIQLPSPGLGDGQTGDNEFVMWTKVKDNFSNTTHAASRLVGTAAGQIPLAESVAKVNAALTAYSGDAKATGLGSFFGDTLAGKVSGLPEVYSSDNRFWAIRYFAQEAQVGRGIQIAQSIVASPRTPQTYVRSSTNAASTEFTPWVKFYTDGNTTIESGTNYLKAASPILRLQHDNFEKEHEAEAMDIKVENPKTGVYKITGTTGLRKNDGWYFSPPKDEHNNVLCMVEVEEDGDIVTVKTYKKKFDFETVSIVPDYDNPTDIPDGATVMLRFNDLPEEQLDESIE